MNSRGQSETGKIIFKYIIYKSRQNNSTVSNWQGGIFNQCIVDNIASYVSQNISCVGREFGTTNIYIRVKQQQHKEKKVFTNTVSSTTRGIHTHTEAKSLTVTTNSHTANSVKLIWIFFCWYKNSRSDKNNNSIIYCGLFPNLPSLLSGKLVVVCTSQKEGSMAASFVNKNIYCDISGIFSPL